MIRRFVLMTTSPWQQILIVMGGLSMNSHRILANYVQKQTADGT
jgi:hypothetical protein